MEGCDALTRRIAVHADRISTAVRAVDDSRLIFFAGVTWGNVGPGFTAPPGGMEFANRSVLAFHYYSPPQMGPRRHVERFIAGL